MADGAGPAKGQIPWSDEAVEKAIDKGIKYLLSRQEKDGGWQHFAGHKQKQVTGPTALVVYALLESDFSVQDPRIAKALDWLTERRTTMTYSLACRCNAWLAANRQTRGKYQDLLMREAAHLVASTNMGTYHYPAIPGSPQGSWDNSNSQFGLLGVWAAKQWDCEIPMQYWQVCINHWEKTQLQDGGWGYNSKAKSSKGTMTAAGVASLFVCFDNLYAERFINCGRKLDYKPIERGLAWFDKRFVSSMSGGDQHNNYYLYGVERVGLAAGYKYFGTQDWYKLGATKLLNSQAPNGSWGGVGMNDPDDDPDNPKGKAPAKDAGKTPAKDAGKNDGKNGGKADGKADAKKAEADLPAAALWDVLAAPAKDAKKADPKPEKPVNKPGEWRDPGEPESRPMDLANTAFALLFLIRGRHPVLFNKLEYEGDWNNRPRDLASLTLWISRTFERTVNWQIVNLKVPVRELHDAPILYIAGSQAPKFNKEELEKLRTFVWQGGCLFSVTECSGKDFEKGMAKVYAELFPEYELTPVDATHGLYAAHFELKGTPKFSVVSNGVRPLAIHTEMDLSKEWQLRNTATRRFAFEAAANLFLYVTDYGSLRNRGTSNWPESEKGEKPKREIDVIRLKHNGNCDPEPLAFDRFRILMRNEADVLLKVHGPAPIVSLDKTEAKVAFMTGTNEFTLSEKEKAAIKSFVEGGGTLMIDAAGGPRFQKDEKLQVNKMAGFAVSVEEMLNDVFGQGALRRLSSNAPMLKEGGKDISQVKYRRETRKRLGGMKEPNLRVVMVGDRPGVIFSSEDLTAGLVGYDCSTIDGYTADSAFDLMRNIVIYADGAKGAGVKKAEEPKGSAGKGKGKKAA